MNILILYGTVEGQTAKITEYIANIFNNTGHQVTTRFGEQLPDNFDLENFDAAIIGSSIHMGDYPKYIEEFVSTHSDWLNSVPSAFFTVCMAIHSQREQSREAAKHFGKDFVARTGWQPELNVTFAGAVKYTQYNFVTRFIMKLISKREGGSTDTSRNHEYTDWEVVARFAKKFATKIEGKEKINRDD